MASDEVSRDTIAAIATPLGRGGIGVVRVSGPQVPQIARAVAGTLPQARCAAVRTFRDARGDRIDEGLVLYFPAPNSYTGEAVLELQGHGGPVVVQMLLGACLDAGARLAEPGEFTRRAFLEGKLDLAQAEAVSDLIDAASQEAARSAQRSLSGEFSDAVHAISAQLTDLRALTEAMLDFPEEEVDPLHRSDASARLAKINAMLDAVIARSRQGSLLREGIHVVIAGAPNVGKSSLLNRLIGAERAIVTAVAGTTRDSLRESVDIQGVPVVFVDTAGIRDSNDEIERLGMERTRQELEEADVVLAVSEVGMGRVSWTELPTNARRLDVFNKSDLATRSIGIEDGIVVSAKTGAGIDALRRAILEVVGWSFTGESVFLARERHLKALENASVHLGSAGAQMEQAEFFAEELRIAQIALGSITGEVSADDLLGTIFSRFCIGK